MAFFAMMNPISNLPAYMALVADDSQKISRKIAFRSLLIAFVIITVFIFSGDFIFKVFGITIVSFRIAGGILVAVIGYHMINGNHSPSYKGMEQQAVNLDPMSIAISPLAMPLFAGPGTITTALSLANGGLRNQLITVVAFALLCVITYLLLRSAKQIADFLGKNLMKIITKMMGLLLFSIGIQMIIVSVQTLIKQ
ncbi:MarC family protein [Streptococcus vestibularis]|uniref:MarC family protein n=1 Tax=Streptococcus vestibularis TaxID=1343 RepID=UPI00232DA07B|nr:MarC family protein [Streptococcus vestibularis]MDB6184742.1 MarC family protein [Streptococcus vestibularis]MDB6201589.1 MarC family protein [Streptococcus vestibularis]MDB6207788.1 MarC family protein [Streptococcus vestibularis]MDB6211617.1 MarC family protein [Streptococcus vestibularis]MDB6215684.1 MarC family protein [Streptococcus vestibularis]